MAGTPMGRTWVRTALNTLWVSVVLVLLAAGIALVSWLLISATTVPLWLFDLGLLGLLAWFMVALSYCANEVKKWWKS